MHIHKHTETKGKILYRSHGRFQRMLLWEKVKRMHMSGGKICDFWQQSPFISEMVSYTPMVAIEG